MSYLSYAQNFEDVILWRALHSVQNGFYIDLGAWSPDVHSVTRLFYEHNWHGINVEPNPVYFAELVKQRLRDINLQVAIGDKDGTAEMSMVADTGLSTLHEPFAIECISNGWEVKKEEVSIITLKKLYEVHVPAGQEVHFLKIDVEGFEKYVLLGNDWAHCRPWVIVLEAMIPNRQEENHSGWEHILLDNDYHFVYADGLNRFYLAKEHSELLAYFKYPPNIFDGFSLSTGHFAQTISSP